MLFTDASGNPLELTFTTASGLALPMVQPAVAVPGPATFALLGIGLAGIGFARRRKREVI